MMRLVVAAAALACGSALRKLSVNKGAQNQTASACNGYGWCFGSDVRCEGNSCCPGVPETGNLNFPCPCAEPGWNFCQTTAPGTTQAPPSPTTPTPTPPAPSPTPSPAPPPQAGCYGEFDALVSDEGNEVGTGPATSVEACKAACDSNSLCNSFSFCPQWSGCWLKDRVLTGSEATTSVGECQTFYKRPSCEPTPAPTLAPTPAPTPRPPPGPPGFWSNGATRAEVCPGHESGACRVPPHMNLILDASMDVGSLTIEGSLTWDVAADNLELRAGFVVAEGPEAVFELGSPQSPMLNAATVYIKNNGMVHEGLGKRTFGTAFTAGASSGPSFRIHGRPLTHTYSLLIEDAEVGDRSLRVDRDVATASGSLAGGGAWRVGDRVGLAQTGYGNKDGETFIITSLRTELHQGATSTVIGLDTDVKEARLGNPALNMQAELVHLSRNVLLTGDDGGSNDEGWHGIAAWGNRAARPEDSGSFRIEYARAEKCGQAGRQGKYCLHFHSMGDCGMAAGSAEPRCLFRGNALEYGFNRGLTVHDTHRSLVDRNILWNVNGAGIYIEDGNEMGNLIQENVNVCPKKYGCRVPCSMNIDGDNCNADDVFQSGMWTLSPTNDFLFNRMVYHEHGFFLQSTAFSFGKGFAQGKVCTKHSPWGNITGNVHHSCKRFGFYPDSNFPRRLQRSVASNGYVEDWYACENQFTPDGRDLGAPAIVVDALDWASTFVGAYGLGDVQMLRYHSMNNAHAWYVKTSKNFATQQDIGDETWDTGRQIMSAASPLPLSHIKDSIIENLVDPYVQRMLGDSGVHNMILGPGGHGTWIVENTKFSGPAIQGIIMANNACQDGMFGPLCQPTFQLVNCDLSGTERYSNWPLFRQGMWKEDKWLAQFNTNHAADFGGYTSVAPENQEHLLQLRDSSGAPLCRRSQDIGVASRFDDGILCTRPLRRLTLWTPQLPAAPRVSVVGGGAAHEMGWNSHYPGKEGYAMVVMTGVEYRMTGLAVLPGDVPTKTTLEYSDDVFGNYLNSPDAITLTVETTAGASRRCEVSSQHDRRFIGYNGADRGGYGACTA